LSQTETRWQPTATEGVWIGEATEAGPTVGIIGGVHGHETAGVAAVKDMLEGRSPVSVDRGRVILMLGNLAAIEANLDCTAANLNRLVKPLTPAQKAQDPSQLPYEIVRAQQLMPYFDECEALLDFHEFNKRGAGPFIICEPPSDNIARAIGAPVISSGWSKAEAGGTDDYMYKRGKVGICYELGWLKEPELNTALAHQVAQRFLSAQSVTAQLFEPLYNNPRLIEAMYAVLRTDDHFKLGDDKFVSFQPLVPGQLIAEHGEDRFYAGKNQVIIFPYTDPEHNTEAFVIGRDITATIPE
jgi:succinylglutamate desuccinylase